MERPCLPAGRDDAGTADLRGSLCADSSLRFGSGQAGDQTLAQNIKNAIKL
jgi:hypothetical protein